MSDGGQQAAFADGGSNVDLSPGVTTEAFDPIVPPLRIPVPAGVHDESSKGEWLLAFKDEESWRRGWQMCHGKISQQCEMGARMGCSISAANVCRIPWWKQALVFMRLAKVDGGERAACEEREMTACLASSKETCNKYARDTCDPVFAQARIVESHVHLDPRFTHPPRRSMFGKGKNLEDGNAFEEVTVDASFASGDHEGSQPSQTDFKELTTNYRGRLLMERESPQRPWDGPAWGERVVDSATSPQTEAPMERWEGGLIMPKRDSQTKQSGDISAPNVTNEEPFWHGVGDRVKSLFKDVRL
ncbi:unnamed protein product [Calypogeia fissa]